MRIVLAAFRIDADPKAAPPKCRTPAAYVKRTYY